MPDSGKSLFPVKDQGWAGPSGERRGPPPGERGAGGPPPGFAPDDGDEELGGPDIVGLDRGDRLTYRQMTPAGKAAFKALDPHDLPANNCMSNGLPSLVAIPGLQQWSFDGDALTIHYANFSARRTIYLDGRPAEVEHSLYGHSVGQFDHGVLTITTTGYTATPGGLGRNAPGSASRSTVERYRLSPDGQSISGMLRIHDPEYLTHDMVRPIALSRAAGVTEIEDLPCDVEDSQRYLN